MATAEPLTTRRPPEASRPVAVVDIGATAIRMAVAEIDSSGEPRVLERLARGVNLGKDTFGSGEISKSTIEECVRVLRDYRRVLDEYQIEGTEGMHRAIRVVATSAVREAGNVLAFVDRIYSAVGLPIEILDEAEVTRITYLGVLPFLEQRQSTDFTTVVEVGGGSTEILVAEGEDVVWAHSYRLGSIRLREMLESYQTSVSQTRALMEDQIRRTVEEVSRHVPRPSNDIRLDFLGLGGDLRIAADSLEPDWDRTELQPLSIRDLRAYTNDVLSRLLEDLVNRFHLTFPEAETLGPALLTYVRLAEAFHVERILASDVNLRSGLLEEMASPGLSTGLRRQVVGSAWELAKKYAVDEPHAKHVADLAQTLFEQLQSEHGLEDRYGLTLYLAAMLHEAGLFVNHNGFHKHSQYLIRNSEVFGLGRTDMLLVALVARYHRRASPKPTHDGYASLDRERRLAVAKLAALLRTADALDRSRSGRIQNIQCTREKDRIVITVTGIDDLSLERLALDQKGSLFEEIFGCDLLLRAG